MKINRARVVIEICTKIQSSISVDRVHKLLLQSLIQTDYDTDGLAIFRFDVGQTLKNGGIVWNLTGRSLVVKINLKLL